jgi:riboflavin kinase/FMN adenylyltransferase
MDLASKYLGYDYCLSGTVSKGKQLGRTIGFPTANLKIEEEYKLIPQDGVYVVQSTINKKLVKGIMNIGTNPTVDGKNKSIEVHYFDFNEDVYHEKITVSILHRIRSEQKFENVSQLKKQLELDSTIALAYFKSKY